MARVEQLRDKRDVQLLVTITNILWLDKDIGTESTRMVDNFGSTSHTVSSDDKWAFSSIETIENHAIDFRILYKQEKERG